MKRISRREFTRTCAVLFGTTAAVPMNPLWGKRESCSLVNGVQIGVQSYSFRDHSLDATIKAIGSLGIDSVELWQGHLEPRGLSGKKLSRWRLESTNSFFNESGKKFQQVGIKLNAYNYSFRKTMSDVEIERGFLMAKALGANVITASSNPSMARRIDLFAQKHTIRVGMHNHAQGGKKDEFEGPEDFAVAMEGTSNYICINLDIGHFVAAGFDPLDYINQHHDRIVTLHLKDRKKGLGPKSPILKFGTGDTPIKEVLQLLKAKKYPIPANIEHEIKGQPAMKGVQESFEYCRKALA